MLGTACTFLGPSRKRGPPKGYIDAIEARLHQTEALIGILLSSRDSRAMSLLDDLRECLFIYQEVHAPSSQDPTARDIINRVDHGTYGYKGRMKSLEPPASAKIRPPKDDLDSSAPTLPPTHPSGEWQDHVISHLNSIAADRNTLVGDEEPELSTVSRRSDGGAVSGSVPPETSSTVYPPRLHSEDEPDKPRLTKRPTLTLQPPVSNPAPGPSSSLLTPFSATTADRSDSDQIQSSARRLRRRVDAPEDGVHSRRGSLAQNGKPHSPSSLSGSNRSRSPVQYAHPPIHPALLNSKLSKASLRNSVHSLDVDGFAEVEPAAAEENDGSGEDELALAVGQLSINEDEQVRYHGKASGLHLLGASDRGDDRVEGGIWRFPGARVWPPLPPGVSKSKRTNTEIDWVGFLPAMAEQEYLLEIYWVYVHPALPIIHKSTFMESFRDINMRPETANTPDSQYSGTSSSSSTKQQRIPTILLLAMFSIASRYTNVSAGEIPPPEAGSMWAAGDSYLESAKKILDSTYAHSRPGTLQALLLMGYREVGIGAMAQAWLYIGMAVRMAQDMGLHKSADKWVNVGKILFTPDELQERRRIWYGCVVMDKYVSSYIGRPVAIFENDFDTELPDIDQPDEHETWTPHPSLPTLEDPSEFHPQVVPSATSNAISCFNEFAKLSIILSMIVQIMYPIRRHVFRSSEYVRLEKLLDKWYYELPDHLQFDPASSKESTLPPHGLTLHMHYWCTVLLLHRPFIRHASESGERSPTKEHDVRETSRKAYDLCAQAANHISSIVFIYIQKHCPRRASVFLSYYVFTAAIMHVATLKSYPDDPQAGLGLHRCMDILHRMQSIWPSAWRAYQLIQGSKVHPQDLRASVSPSGLDRRKRSADHALEQHQAPLPEPLYRDSQGYARPPSSAHPQQAYPIRLDISPVEPPTFFPPFERWGPDGTPMGNFSGGTLTTSVLPQQFSTGFDARTRGHSDRSAQRFPQYWNDYSAIGQIESAYTVPPSEMVPSHSGSAPSRGSQQGVVYPQDQFLVFNNMPPGGQS
ncbi:hypothetical protein EUX98_g4687 [Antrodiella citrinella]|uniref:Xylanolytic transcriptional activator regulatory domain-containing protein n=1 Tax=Antrodiella citrinella TaxID=2447956 RepID=A0A4S4MTI4_9APHY|nr:hypothetical protein EUX98_g4687 [Antrodiella citrinella]